MCVYTVLNILYIACQKVQLIVISFTDQCFSLSPANGMAEPLTCSSGVGSATSPKQEPPPSPHANRKRHRRKKSTGITKPDGPSTGNEGKPGVNTGVIEDAHSANSSKQSATIHKHLKQSEMATYSETATTKKQVQT